jgi:hypothetical protein
MSNENQWPSTAGDTGNVLDGTALGALLGGNGAAAGFSIDYERVRSPSPTSNTPRSSSGIAQGRHSSWLAFALPVSMG